MEITGPHKDFENVDNHFTGISKMVKIGLKWGIHRGFMKIMFLDESGDHNLEKIDQQYPVFVLAGAIFDNSYYFSNFTFSVFANQIYNISSK